MLHQFLDANRRELIARCRERVARRPAPRPTSQELEHGIPLFLGQLIETLRLEQAPDSRGTGVGPPPSRDAGRQVASEIGDTAARHGRELLQKGFTVDQVVHDYGDLCQAVIELAIEKNEPVSRDSFSTLNRCLDNAIADAVTEYDRQRAQVGVETGTRAMSERLGSLAHELRNFLNTAILSFAAIKSGSVGLDGATSRVLDRSLVGLRDLIDRALADVRLSAGLPTQLEDVAIDGLIADIQVSASLEAKTRGCEFMISPVEPGLVVRADRQMIYSALSNLVQNAFKFTRPRSRVSVKAYGTGERVLIEVEDQCGGLGEGKAEVLFRPFEQHDADRSGLGLGLAISRRAVEASAGKLHVRDLPGLGCVFTIDLPRREGAGAPSGPR